MHRQDRTSVSGQERFGNMTRVYYKEAVGAFVVFDVTRGSTFEAVSKWKHDLDSKVKLANGSPIPSVLLANKCDQKNETSNNTSLMDNFCKETGFLGWFETSAKVGKGSVEHRTLNRWGKIKGKNSMKRTTSTWMRQLGSWWRTSCSMTRACRTRRATETASNWTRRRWLPRVSQAAASSEDSFCVHPPARTPARLTQKA
uniref:ras-related protein Rab-7L1-like isoform X3 n=1 Tax=Oncorhynchus gorbuscha TaxID=8017 RepID=UPI001EAF5EA9|nr:ras-related protein Rab-7L1-like isoform X3 [Oncorhynchus gorbuscha]